MADEVIKRLLIKLGVDRSDFDNAMKEVKRTMDTLYQAERAKSAQKKVDAQEEAASTQAQVAASKVLNEATQAHLSKLKDASNLRGKELEEMKQTITQERVQLDAKVLVLRVMGQQGILQGVALHNLQQEVALERSNLAIKQAQLRAALTQSSSERRQGFAGGLLEGFSSRLAGTIGFSVLSAEGLGRIFEMAYEKVKELGRALMEATGPAQTLRKEFEYLAAAKGVSPDEMISKLRTATRNLVSDEKLITTGNAFLRSDAKITSEQFIKLTSDVTKLARASGHDVPQALDALQRTLQTGRGYTLAYALGLTNVRELMVKGIPAGASEATRSTLSLNQAMVALDREAAKVVVTATTLPELFKQMHNQSENFIDGIAQGLTSTSSFKDAIGSISAKLTEMQPKLEQMAKSFGEKVANAIKWVTDHTTELKMAFIALIGLRVADWILTNSDRWTAWGNVISWVTGKIGLLTKAEKELVAVQAVEKIVGGVTNVPIARASNVLGKGASVVEEDEQVAGSSAIPAIAPGISKLLNTGKGGLAYGARSAQLAGSAAEEPNLFSGLQGLGELGTISVQAESSAAKLAPELAVASAEGGVLAGVFSSISGVLGTMLGYVTSIAEVIGGVLLSATTVVAASVVVAAGGYTALTAGILKKHNATLKDMLAGLKELAIEIGETMKEAWTGIVNTIKPIWTGFVNWATTTLTPLVNKINQITVPRTGKTIWQTLKDEIVDAAEAALPFGIELDFIVGKLKELAEVGAGRKILDSQIKTRASGPPISGAAADEEKRLEAARIKALANRKPPPEMNLELDKQLAQERLKLAEEEAKSRFAIIKEELDNEEAALKAKYDIGLLDLNNYITQEKSLRKKELDARLQEIETDRQQKIKEIRSQASTVQTGPDGKQSFQLEAPSLTAAKVKVVDEAAHTQTIQAEAQYQKQLADLLYQRLNDEMAAQKTYEEAAIKVRKDGLAAQAKALEDHFKRGEVSADVYEQKRKEFILAERDAVLAELNLEEESSKKTDDEKAKFTVKRIQAQIDAEKQLAQVEEGMDAVRLQAAENTYKRQLELNTAQQQLAQYNMQTGKPGAEGQNLALLHQAMDLDEQQLSTLTDMLKTQKDGSAEWYQTVKDIGEVNVRLTETNKKLAEAKDFAAPLATIFEQISNVFSDSKTAKWLSNLSQGLKELSDAGKKLSEQGGGISPAKGLLNSFTSLFKRPTSGKVVEPPKTIQETADAATKHFGQTAESSAKQLDELAKSSHTTAEKLQTDWQDAIKKVNDKLQTAADSLNAKLVGAMQPFVVQVNAATQALAQFTATASKKSGSSQGDGNVTDTGAEVPLETSNEDFAIGGDGAPTNDSGVAGTVPGDNGTSDMSSLSSILKVTSGEIGNLGDASKKATGGFTQWLGSLKGFLGKLGAYGQQVEGFIKAISGAQTTKQGILAGGISGFKIGAQFGPWGAVIGAAVGASIGGLVGHKEAMAKEQAAQIQTRLEQIKDSLANNTMTMGAAIGNLEQLRTSVVSAMHSSGKKGNKAGLPQELQAINDQITQLLEEQKKILTDLGNQLGILLEPTQYQDILNNLDQIIVKYQTFASAAAGNSAAMAQANQWLVASLAAYATAMGNQVRSANEQAISDATKLIDLQDQLNQEQLQEYDILTRGVMGRQRSQAQQKGSEIEQVEQQKQQTQSEFALQKYKVDAESKMFDLAHSRLGLEQQMVALQEKDFDLWAAQVQAMQQTLSKLQSALGAGGTLPAGLLNATGGVDIQALEQLLGLPTTATGPGGATGQPFIQNEPAVFQEFVDIIDQNTSFKNFGADLLSAAATPAGSAQRQMLVGDLSANHWEIAHALEKTGAIAKPVNGKSQDPNWLNFFGWILNQAKTTSSSSSTGTVPTPTLPSLPGFSLGGMVPNDMQAVVHAGEYIIPSDVFTNFIAVMGRFTSSINNKIGNGMSTAASSHLVKAGTFNLGGTDSLQLQSHQGIFDLASSRIGMEHSLLSAQRQQTILEMDRMSQMSDLLGQMYKVQGSGVQSLEGAWQKVYEIRGRMGSGGFRREVL